MSPFTCEEGVNIEKATLVEAGNMNRIILADSQAMFQAGTAKALAMDEYCRIIGQCADVERMLHLIATYPGAIVLFASSLHPDMGRLRMVLEAARSYSIVIAENNESIEAYLHQGVRGVLFRNMTGTELLQCVHRVAAGDIWEAPQQAPEYDMVGARVLKQLTPKEILIVALIGQGCKNREIGLRLRTTEQVIKNCLRTIYDKAGVNDRLELALFTINHKVLAQMAAEMGSKLEAEDQQAAPTAAA
jgi:DNA-binding NarL/FixJ family response regulator